MSNSTDISLDDPVVITTATGQNYRATLQEGVVKIEYEDNERWRREGESTWDGSRIVECNSDLGEDGYELLNAAILEALED
jgi:hypothetical protein